MLSRPPATRDDEGNIVLAVLVLMVITLLATALFTEAFRGLSQSRSQTDESRADAAAELAVNEAFARIDAGETSRFTGSGESDATPYRYEAILAGASSWQVRGEARSGDLSRALAGVVSREAQFPFTLFVDEQSSLDRNSGRISGRVGTNGTMDVTGPSPGDVQELFRPDAHCSGCTAPAILDGPRPLPPIGRPQGVVQPCPIDGRFIGIVDGRGGEPYVCDDADQAVSFESLILVLAPPLVVYVGPSVPLTFDGSLVNPTGPAADLQVFVDGDESDRVSSITATGADISGLINAPGRSLATSDTVLKGALTLRALDLSRTGRLDIAPDATIAPLGNGDWKLGDLRSVASNG